ncbi:MAG: hypothetical protein WBN31_02145 [Gammaproteobacteria bacterium]
MTPQRLTTVMAIVAMLSAFAANADELVDRADANGDGYVSLYELRAAYYADREFNRRIEQSFADYDTDGDGLISEAERRARAVATAETAPGAGTATTASGETAVTAGTGAAPATASGETPVTPATGVATATASGEMAVTPATGTAPATAAGMASTPAAVPVATPAAEVASTPAAGSSTPAPAEMAPTRAAEPVSVGTPGMDTGADRPGGASPEVAAATTTAGVALPGTSGLSRSELWIQQIDTDNSGGASMRELVASGDGDQWFHERDFTSADKNGDDDLDPDELEVLIQSMERRQRR